MEMQWGGGAEGAARLIFLATKSMVCFAFSISWKNTLRLKLRHIVALSQLETERNYTRTTHSNLRVLVQFAFKLG